MIPRFLFGFSMILLVAFTLDVAQQVPKKEAATKLEQFLAEKEKLIGRDSQEAGVLNGHYRAKGTVEALNIYAPGKERAKIRDSH